mmetsp:Transcript_79800/g.158573  ORF Transcript_79800/g.158573 Transcript_79800/m.158573 type:complete len:180 (-) Transcript_79800:148-687(-)
MVAEPEPQAAEGLCETMKAIGRGSTASDSNDVVAEAQLPPGQKRTSVFTTAAAARAAGAATVAVDAPLLRLLRVVLHPMPSKEQKEGTVVVRMKILVVWEQSTSTIPKPEPNINPGHDSDPKSHLHPHPYPCPSPHSLANHGHSPHMSSADDVFVQLGWCWEHLCRCMHGCNSAPGSNR